MKASSDHFKERFRANMSAEAWQALTDQMEERGPMLLNEVQLVQLRITDIFRTDQQMV